MRGAPIEGPFELRSWYLTQPAANVNQTQMWSCAALADGGTNYIKSSVVLSG
jgi:hypothetical protein